MKIGVEYLRYSSDKQTEQSIEGQMHVCDEYAKRNNIKIVARYIDRALTATNDNRREFQRMIKDSGKKTWDYVLVYKLDRFSRDKYENAIHRHTLKMNGVKLLSAMENIPDTPEGIILESLLEGMNQYYSAELSQKVKRGMRETRLKGNFTGGSIIFGYKVTGDKLTGRKVVPNENEAPIIKQIFELYAYGFTAKEIIKELENNNITQRGKTFPIVTIYHILHNERYIGRFTSCDGTLNTNTFPPIISEDLFNKVKEKLRLNNYGKQSKYETYLLRNKVICGYCHGKINGDGGTSKSGRKFHYYTCNNLRYKHKCNKKRIPKDILEKIIVDTTIKVLSQEHYLSYIAEMILKRHRQEKTDNSHIKTLEKEQLQTQTAINNIISAIEQGIITPSTKQRLNELEIKLEEIKANISLAQTQQPKEIKKENIIYRIKSTLQKKPKIMVNALIKKIILYDDKVEIIYNFDEDSPDNDRGCLFYTNTINQLAGDLRVPKKCIQQINIALFC